MSDQDSMNATPPIPPSAANGKRRPSPMSWIALILTIITLVILIWFWQQSRSSDAGIKGRLNLVESTVLNVQDLIQATRNTAIAAENIADALEKRLDAMDHHLDARTDALQSQIDDLNNSLNSISGLLRQRRTTALLVAEARNLVAQAQQHLQFGGNTTAVITALDAANQYLRETGDPSLAEARKAIDDVASALKKRPATDTTTLTQTLGNLEQQIEKLPVPGTNDIQQPIADGKTEGFTGLVHKIWEDIKNLVSIRHQSDPNDLALLPPDKRFFLQQNLRLQLATARLALLQHNNAAFHDAIDTTHKWLNTYYDPRTPEIQAFLRSLAAFRTIDLSIPEPGFKRAMELLNDWQQRHQPSIANIGQGNN